MTCVENTHLMSNLRKLGGVHFNNPSLYQRTLPALGTEHEDSSSAGAECFKHFCRLNLQFTLEITAQPDHS